MVINVDSDNLTAIALDDADNPTKQAVFGNWNPVELRKWKSEEELINFIESSSYKYWTDYVAPEVPAE